MTQSKAILTAINKALDERFRTLNEQGVKTVKVLVRVDRDGSICDPDLSVDFYTSLGCLEQGEKKL